MSALFFLFITFWGLAPVSRASPSPQAAPDVCRSVADCRAQADAAAAAGDYERFHDLAWRTVQKGKPNDPDLMYLLARAQSLSGRPDDAQVMIGRILDQGATPPDVATSEDFRNVRALKSWPALEARLHGAAPSGPEVHPAPSAPAVPAVPAVPAAPSAPLLAPSAPLARSDALAFDPPPDADFMGLAHDEVSRRFVVGDRRHGRLIVIDEHSHHVVNYVSAASAGFYEDLTGFALDARRGDLWVVSAKGTGKDSASILHKLQLVSGRALLEVAAPGPGVRLVALAIAPSGTVYALDAAGSRIFRLHPGGRALEVLMPIDVPGPAALAAADDRVLYVASTAGLTRIDVGARTATAVTSKETLTDFVTLDCRPGSLIGLQRGPGGASLVRLPLDPSGTRALSRHVLASSLHETAGGLAGESFYYLADRGSIRRLTVK